LSANYAFLPNDDLLLIEGPAGLEFLQGQVTCDTSRVSPRQAALGAYCTPQGRVVCDFLLCQPEEQLLALRMRRDIVASSAETLGRYIIFSRATIRPAGEPWTVAGVWGDAAANLVARLVGATPDGPLGCVSRDQLTAVQLDGDGARFELYAAPGARSRLEQALPAGAAAADSGAWDRLQIESGIARLEAPLQLELVPQMLNYDLTGHISFRKGCYTGQEVIARLHYRGTPKRRLFIATAAGPAPAVATPVCTQDPAKPVGQVINSVDLPGGGCEMLAVIATAAAASRLRLGDASGAALEVKPLAPEAAGD
jgi:folate-binding protein YgfZ